MEQIAQKFRLKSIKLAGFKSFVDSTVVEFPSNLAAVVGPNGCGKSNIIDAVRWVMGESSAKHLRGESMADVIFNGSTQRKPVGQASIELAFDNPNGVLGGEYAHYSEILIRREVTRDGQSDYFLNNTRCRRRDIVDIFLGTGLGPRSYAIISQGTISRIIEAKPDELRAYLEEAAGISKYKERRRETENRMKHTVENLERLTDLRDELGRQLEHLQRQAQAASRYTELKTQERLYSAQLTTVRWRLLDEQIVINQDQTRVLEVSLEAHGAQLHKADAQIELLRENQHEAQENFHEVQAHFYEAGAQITQLEQSLKHQKERIEQYEQDIAHVEQERQAAAELYQEDNERIQEINKKLESIKPDQEKAAQILLDLTNALQLTETNAHEWYTIWDTLNTQIAEQTRMAQVEQTRIQHLETALSTNKTRQARLQEELNHLDTEPLTLEIDDYNEQITQQEIELERHQHNLEQCQYDIRQQREFIKENEVKIDQSRSELQQMRGRLSSLEALQQAATGKQNHQLKGWIEKYDLQAQPALVSQLQVVAGWEMAVETVLGNYLQAVCVNAIDPLSSVLDDLGDNNIALYEMQTVKTERSSTPYEGLSGKIQSSLNLEGLLSKVYIADELTAALSMRASLAEDESVITRDGIWIGKNWLRVNREKDASKGMIAREQEIRTLSQSIEEILQNIASIEKTLNESREKLTAFEENRTEQQLAVNESNKQLSDLKAQLRIRHMRLDQIQQRLHQLEQELDESSTQITDFLETLEEARQAWNLALSAIEKYTIQRESLQTEREQIQKKLEEAKNKVNEATLQKHQIEMSTQTLETELHHKQEQQKRLSTQNQQLEQRYQYLLTQLEQAQTPLAGYEEKLETLLDNRYEAEQALEQARIHLQTHDHALREQEQLRQFAQKQVDEVKEKLENFRMQSQVLLTRRTTLEETLLNEGDDLKTLLAELPAEANEAAWSEELQRIAARIARLGAINLAAIEEFQAQSERKNYLDEQHADLTQALQTLEDAIRKIDRETRQRFKETFDAVNQHFKLLFPKIFGGGSAMLEMTGEDLLDTGVTVMAQPPGKKNSTIHLLSGGEKALTAIALVFAIFQLNPAPFCMLDEVDAPLDDANVVRFSNLVKEMSAEVQFIFISHNKVAIAMAEHLLGITMKEPGVSRLVSVNIEEAIAMAEA